MSSRRRAREFAMQALYAVDLSGVSGAAALSALWAGRLDDADAAEAGDAPVSPEESEFAQALVRGVVEDREQIDARIEAASVNWRLARMPVVDRNILRIGAHEIATRSDIPASVSINEAIELAKRFGGGESKAFVNGILDRIATEVGRGRRNKR